MQTAPERARPTTEAAAPRVLLVEDNPINMKLAKRLLERLGCRVDTAENGEEGVRMHQAGSYDAIFMDCQMPVMDGFEAARRIREAGGEGPRLPIIAVTANVLPDDQVRCFASGMDDIITKPLQPNVFAEALARWCGYRTPSAA
ncbi:MAG TPA: response regulator [Candidatus Krumholzibacteria bacterium]|nr:response regulator [Candidatus Krumholzibacteria bacterium]